MSNRSRLVTRIISKRQIKTRRNWKTGSALGRKVFLVLSALLAVAAVVLLVWIASLVAQAAQGLPSITLLPTLLDSHSGSLLQPTRILDRTGQIQIDSLSVPNSQRQFVSLAANSPDSPSGVFLTFLVNSLQPDFWSSPGIHFNNLIDPTPVTLAERLAHDLLLWSEPEGSLKALRMRLLALQIVATYGCQQTLEWFVNSLYFGHNVLGVEEAARVYLGKPATQLNMADAALLLAIVDAPALNPLDAPGQAKVLQEQLLTQLFVKERITQTEYATARQQPLSLNSETPPEPGIYSAFTRLMLSQLEPEFPNYRLERGGLVIVTTLDNNLQQQAACLLQSRLAQWESRPSRFQLPGGQLCSPLPPPSSQFPVNLNLPSDLAASMVTLDPQSGELLALLGDQLLNSMSDSLLSHAPGSTLTPFVAVAAFSRGVSPATMFWDVPSENQNSSTVAPMSTGGFHGPVRFRTALGEDWLRPITSEMNDLGLDTVWKLAEPFGLLGLTQSGQPANLLYSGGTISPLRLAQAYSVFATLGSMHGWQPGTDTTLTPITVIKVTDENGESIWTPELKTQPVLSTQLAFLVHDVLSSGQGWQQSEWMKINPSINRPAGVKLGQTSDRQNVWSVGYTPQRLTAIWLGLTGQPGAAQLESAYAGELWQVLMNEAHSSLPVLGWTTPPGIRSVMVCDPSGLLPTKACPQTVQEVFLNGSEPTLQDTLYQESAINKETGRLATVYTPVDLVEQKVFWNVPSTALSWAESAGIALPPKEYDLIQSPPFNADVNINQPAIFSAVSGIVQVVGSASSIPFKSAWVEVGKGIAPTEWQKLGNTLAAPVIDGVLAKWDTSGLDGLFIVRLVVLHPDQSFDSSVIQVTVDNIPPTVTSLSPVNNEKITLTSSGWIVLRSEVGDNLSLDRVEWWMDGMRIGERLIPPFTLPWQATAGRHTLFIRTYDEAGNLAQSDTVSFEIVK